jgi:hypothetical protein
MACAVGAQSTRTEPQPIRVGTFDSRAIAVAYAHSPQLEAWMKPLVAARDAAKAAGDLERVRKLEAEGAAHQKKLHEQGFSTGSVSDLLALIAADLPAIADGAGVDLVVSRFDVAWQRQGVETVDVTDRLIEPFHPSEKTRKMIEQVREQEPVPLGEIHD